MKCKMVHHGLRQLVLDCGHTDAAVERESVQVLDALNAFQVSTCLCI